MTEVRSYSLEDLRAIDKDQEDMTTAYKVMAKFDALVKSRKIPLPSFRRKPESCHFNSFWPPAFSGVTELGFFTSSSNLNIWEKSLTWHFMFH